MGHFTLSLVSCRQLNKVLGQRSWGEEGREAPLDEAIREDFSGEAAIELRWQKMRRVKPIENVTIVLSLAPSHGSVPGPRGVGEISLLR